MLKFKPRKQGIEKAINPYLIHRDNSRNLSVSM